MNRSIVIAGKNNIACDVLEWIYKEYHDDVDCFVVCNRDDAGKDGWQRSLRATAETLHVRELQLDDVYSMNNTIFLSLEFDRIIKPEMFITQELYNIHFSLLPQYKGMYTSVLPILNGDKKCGVTLHRIDRGIDTGEIICQEVFECPNYYTSRDLYYRYMKLGTQIVKENMNDILQNRCNSYAQPIDGSSYYKKGSVDFTKDIDIYNTASSISRQIRAYRFREYQMPQIGEWKISSCEIENVRSCKKPGTVMYQDEDCVIMSTIDYDIILNIDQYDRVFKACRTGDLTLLQSIRGLEYYFDDKNKYKQTPFMVAEDAKQLEIIEYLLEYNVKIDEDC